MKKELLESELPKRSPWGKPDYGYRLADGITQIGTPSHGGIHLSRARQAKMPGYFKAECADGNWYEEDCAWCVVAIAFPDAFDAKSQDAAKDTLRNWFPALYEYHYDVKLKPGESFKRDEETFARESVNMFVPRTAWGDWEGTTPKGFVKVLAERKADGARKYFLVPKDEYRGNVVCDAYPETTPALGV
jgi:hypothetical protein